MRKLFLLTLLISFFGMAQAQVDCSTFTLWGAQETGLAINLPTFTGCSSEPTYQIDYQEASGGAWMAVNPFYFPASGPYSGFFFFGLTACTEYNVRVKVYCNGNYEGECIGTFETKGCQELDCNDVTVINIGTTTADIQLANQSSCADPTTGEILYKLRYKKSTDNWGPFVNGISNGSGIVSLAGLDACTEYDYEIRLICNGAPTTVCSGTFNTICGDCNDITAINVTDNSADIVLDGFDDCRDGGNLTYDLRYRISGGVWTSLTGLVTSGTIHSLMGLSNCEVYQYEVTIKCNEKELTCSGSFTTTGCDVKDCDGVTVPFVTENRAYVLFTGFEDCQNPIGGYTVRYDVYNHSTNTWAGTVTVGLGQNFFGLFNLDPCTEYTVELEVLCGKIYSNLCTVTFTTDGENCLTSGGGSSKRGVFSDTPVTAYPNPFTEGLTLDFGLEEAQEVTIELHDVMGKVVYSSTRAYQAGINSISIEGQDFPAGILFYTVETATDKKSGRVVKQ